MPTSMACFGRKSWSPGKVPRTRGQGCVPATGTDSDLVIRVAALLRNLSSDIKAPSVPTWWRLGAGPKSGRRLKAVGKDGYSDAAKWFTQGPQSAFDCISCRASATWRSAMDGSWKPGNHGILEAELW
eukprot:Skav209857  [mRNA]  locus=scaffold1684:124044:127523:+ [translate_table: standard]